jgi:hypothetical protein
MELVIGQIYSNKKKKGEKRDLRKILNISNEFVEYEDKNKKTMEIPENDFVKWAYEPVYYQIEVKRYLLDHKIDLWDDVVVDIDAEELGKDDLFKKLQSDESIRCLNDFIGVNEYRTDIKATDRATKEKYFIEVEGFSSKQQDQAFYSALSQIILRIENNGVNKYGIAVPFTNSWIKQISKISTYIRSTLKIHLFLVDKNNVIEIQPNEDILQKVNHK